MEVIRTREKQILWLHKDYNSTILIGLYAGIIHIANLTNGVHHKYFLLSVLIAMWM